MPTRYLRHFIFDRSSKISSYFQRYNIECKIINPGFNLDKLYKNSKKYLLR